MAAVPGPDTGPSRHDSAIAPAGASRWNVSATTLATALDWFVAWMVVVLALWTVGYHVALLLPLSAPFVWWSCALLALVLGSAVAFWSRLLDWFPLAGDATPTGHGVAMVIGLASAALASCLVRPDLDDASYMVRATWVAVRGVLDVGDVIFSNGAWPGLPEQTPYLTSFEGLLGMTARVLGVSAGSLSYVAFVPFAAFGAVWALWSLLRAWRVRRPALALTVATVFLCWGGPLNASWGNLWIGRIWQGKVAFLAIIVPLAYAWATRAISTRPGPQRRVRLALVAALGIASVGLSPSAVFVIPGVLTVSAAAAACAGRWRAGFMVALVGASYPLGAGVVVAAVGHTADAIPGSATQNPWLRTVGSGTSAVVVVAAAAIALAGLLLPRLSAVGDTVGRFALGGSVLAGAAVGIPAVYTVLVDVMRTDAIAWRAVWVVPVPALVGILAVSAWGRSAWSVMPAAALSVLLAWTGTALWSPANGAVLVAPGAWKIAPADRDTARWIVGQDPRGRYLAREEVVAAVGTMTADLSPVGSRPGYVAAYEGLVGAHAASRLRLQNWVDGAGVADPLRIAADLSSLDVVLICGPPSLGDALGADWAAAYRSADTCWSRG